MPTPTGDTGESKRKIDGLTYGVWGERARVVVTLIRLNATVIATLAKGASSGRTLKAG